MEHDKFRQILQASNVSVTSARLAIFATLLTSNRPLKNGEVATLTPHVNRTSIYRTLELFDRLGVTTVITRGWTPFHELAEPFKPHHHHMTCDVCGETIEITSETIESIITEIAAKYAFLPTTHHFEINGTCRTCQALQLKS